jgi:hypothetical protein
MEKLCIALEQKNTLVLSQKLFFVVCIIHIAYNRNINQTMSQCQNCNRRNISTTVVIWERLRHKTRKKYFNIVRSIENEIFLCDLCCQYLLQQTQIKAQRHVYWPSMIWKFLVHQSVNPQVLYLDIHQKW